MKHPVRAAALALATATGLALSSVPPAAAGGGGDPVVSEPLATGLAGPLQLAVARDGTVYVSQSFAGLLTRVDRDGTQTTLARAGEGNEIAGVDVHNGTVTFTTTGFQEHSITYAQLRRVDAGSDTVLARLARYERRNNPDAINTYGFQDLPADCTGIDPVLGGDAGYRGIVEAHPYSVATLRNGTRVVADAAGNDLVRVRPNGRLSTLAVLPPQPMTITSEAFAILNELLVGEGLAALPECVIGSTYAFEPVPTDVEVGPDGQLYVTTLPGGVEDPRLGANGSVYRVDPWTGEYTRIGTGFASATNVAVSPNGTVYVAELFGGRISELVDGHPKTVVEVPLPAAIEWARGRLYATINALGPEGGSVVTIRP